MQLLSFRCQLMWIVKRNDSRDYFWQMSVFLLLRSGRVERHSHRNDKTQTLSVLWMLNGDWHLYILQYKCSLRQMTDAEWKRNKSFYAEREREKEKLICTKQAINDYYIICRREIGRPAQHDHWPLTLKSIETTACPSLFRYSLYLFMFLCADGSSSSSN